MGRGPGQGPVSQTGGRGLSIPAGLSLCPKTYGIRYPKLVDIRDLEIFGDLAREVIGHGKTYLYYDRLYYLYQAIDNASQLAAQGPNLAEVGVYKGGGTYFIAAVVAKLFQEKPLIHAFDTFTGHPDEIDPALDGRHHYLFATDRSGYKFEDYVKYGYPVMAKLAKKGGLGKDFLWCADIQERDTTPNYVDRCHYIARMSKRLANTIYQMMLERGLLKTPKDSKS